MGRISDYERKENPGGEGERLGRVEPRGKEREKENSVGEYRIGFSVESI